MGCKDCKVNFNFNIDQNSNDISEKLEELFKDIEEIIPVILDAFEYWLYKNYDVLLKAKSPYFRLLLQILRQQNELSLLLLELGKRRK